MYSHSSHPLLLSSLGSVSDRGTLETALCSSLHLLLSLAGVFSNFSVIIAALLEPWTELVRHYLSMHTSRDINQQYKIGFTCNSDQMSIFQDNFTFVTCVSVSFNRMLIAFFVYPVNSLAVATGTWKLVNTLLLLRKVIF